MDLCSSTDGSISAIGTRFGTYVVLSFNGTEESNFSVILYSWSILSTRLAVVWYDSTDFCYVRFFIWTNEASYTFRKKKNS